MSYFTVEEFDGDEELIAASCDFIDRVTGQFFELREKTIKLDGRGGKNLVLPVFAYSVDYVKVEGEEIHDYVLYNRMEDRAYPKIFRSSGWPKGKLNVEVSGKFGYVEEDGSTPLAIKRAAMKLAILSSNEAPDERNLRGLLLSETTDGHNYELSENAVTSSITGDTEIDQILRKYTRSKFRMAIV